MLLDPAPTFWERTKIPRRFDLRKLLPASLPTQFRFETREDVIRLAVEREKRLRRTPYDHLALFMADCREGLYPCRLPICPLCARSFRRWLGANNLALADEIADPVTVTLFCEVVPEGQLATVDIPKIHDRVRHAFRRADLQDAVIVGGTEAAYRVEHRDWLIHLHLLVGNAKKSGLKQLRAAWAKTGIPAAMRVSKIKHRPRQIGYLQKFSTFHRPGDQSSWRRGSAISTATAAIRRAGRVAEPLRFSRVRLHDRGQTARQSHQALEDSSVMRASISR